MHHYSAFPNLFTGEDEHAFTLGSATITSSKPVVAGAVSSWKITIAVGAYGIDEGGTIKIAQRFASDWETPQFDRPADPGFTTVCTNGSCILRPYFASKAEERPWMRWCLIIDILDGALKCGDEVTITLGDSSNGSPGIRAQTFVESFHEFRIFIDPTNASICCPIAVSPGFPIVCGPLVRLKATAPSQAWPGTNWKIRLSGEDRWQNPVPVDEHVHLEWQGTGRMQLLENGFFQVLEAGTGMFSGTVGTLKFTSNPVLLLTSQPAQQRFWGDLHAQSDSTAGTGSEDEYFHFGRHHAHLDVIGHQANDFQLTDESFKRLRQAVDSHHSEGEFVIIPGYEWSGNTPSGGDRNVFFSRSDHPIFRSSNWQVASSGATSFAKAHPASTLFDHLRAEGNAIVCSHVGGRYADIVNFYDEQVCKLIEIVSCWGIFEWMISDAIRMKYCFGLVANSDGHKGRPGAEGPGAGEFGISGGLTCILADSLSREAVFEALRERRCYATTGPRMLLDFTMDGKPMGEIFNKPMKEVRIVGKVVGTAPIEKVELYLNDALEAQFFPPAQDILSSSTFRILWGGAKHRGRGRRVCWNGKIRIEGNSIQAARQIAFDSPGDYARLESNGEVSIRSSTTGDCDGVELTLLQNKSGILTFESEQGIFSVTVAGLESKVFVLSGLDKKVTIQRYPEGLTEMSLSVEKVLDLSDLDYACCYLKVTQCDGHLGWSSPCFVRTDSATK